VLQLANATTIAKEAANLLKPFIGISLDTITLSGIMLGGILLRFAVVNLILAFCLVYTSF
jgi:hypothetical protein